MMEFLADLERDPEGVTDKTNQVWKSLVATDKVIVQVAANIADLRKHQEDLVAPWKENFKGPKKSMKFRYFGVDKTLLSVSYYY
jgi:hypothetical protein